MINRRSTDSVKHFPSAGGFAVAGVDGDGEVSKDAAAELAKKLSNPIASLIGVPVQYNNVNVPMRPHSLLSRYNLRRRAVALCGLLLVSLAARADVLELKDGKIVRGKYAGGTVATIRFETEAGVQVFEADQAVALTFTGPAPAPAAPAAAPAPAVAAPVVTAAPATAPAATIPAGAVLLIRMVDTVSSADPRGKRFATTLETDLPAADGSVAFPAGTKVLGRVEVSKQARRMAGKSELDIRLTDVTVAGAMVPISTGPYAKAGARSIGKTAKGAAAGAVVGGVIDGSNGAGKGAAIGAVASGLKKGEAVVIPAGTLLEFRLEQPVTVTR